MLFRTHKNFDYSAFFCFHHNGLGVAIFTTLAMSPIYNRMGVILYLGQTAENSAAG